MRLRLRLRLGFWLGFVHHRSPYRITLRRRPRRRNLVCMGWNLKRMYALAGG